MPRWRLRGDAAVCGRQCLPSWLQRLDAVRRGQLRRRRRTRDLQALSVAQLLHERRRDAGGMPRRVLLSGRHRRGDTVAVPGVDVLQCERPRVGG